MYFDRFDICEAYYMFFCNYHSGMGSKEYRRMSKMTGYFKPSPSLSEDTLSENSRAIYDNLVEKAGF